MLGGPAGCNEFAKTYSYRKIRDMIFVKVACISVIIKNQRNGNKAR